MITPTHFVIAFWIIFLLVWLFSALGAKKNIRHNEWRRDAGIRILLIFVLIILIQVTPSLGVWEYQFGYGTQIVGVILCGLGIAFAIWARWHLGRNWSGTPSIKEGHELITSGPYRLVRHPIYTGMILALLGSALVAGIIWLVISVVFLVNFLYRIPIEEKYMMELFPDQYPEYQRKTKSLIPFLW